MIEFAPEWNQNGLFGHKNHEVEGIDQTAMRRIVESTLDLPGMRETNLEPTMCHEIKLLAQALLTPDNTVTPSPSNGRVKVIKKEDRKLKVLVLKGIHQSGSQHFTVQVGAIESPGVFTYEIFVRQSFNFDKVAYTSRYKSVGISVIVSGIIKYWPSEFYSGTGKNQRVHTGNSSGIHN